MTNRIEIPAEIKAMLHSAPAFSHEEVGVEPGKVVARGFAQYKEFINKNGRPKAEDPRVSISIRLPLSYAEQMRRTGRGWQTRMGNYIAQGIARGDVALLAQ